MKIKEKIRKNKKLYCLLKTIKNCDDNDFCQQVLDINSHPLSITVRSFGELNKDTVIYYCDMVGYTDAGFCATLINCLRNLYVPYLLDLPTVVKWYAKLYIDPNDRRGDNPFVYYYNQPSGFTENDVINSNNVIVRREVDGAIWSELRKYEQSDKTVGFYSKIYSKYMSLNKETSNMFQHDGVFDLRKKSTIGVHVRGTDFNAGWKNHPLPVTPEQYLDATLKLMKETGTERVFLATDDINALNLFIDKLGDKLIYYADTNRTTGKDGVHTQDSNEPGHKYRLGYEILRDVYSLAYCDYLVAGLSNVGHVARIIAHSMDKDFKKCVILSEGIKK